LDAPREKMIKSVVKNGPTMGFFANDGGDATPLFPVDRLVSNLLDGGAASTGQNFGSLKDFVQNLTSTQQKEAAGLAADMVELAYLKGAKSVRMDEAKAYGADDVRQVEARLDAQIEEVASSIRTGVASMPRVDVAEITKLVDASLKDASDSQNKIRGATIKPMDSKGFKKAFNDIYEGLLQPAASRAASERSSIMGNTEMSKEQKAALGYRGGPEAIKRNPQTGEPIGSFERRGGLLNGFNKPKNK